jgi:hypothetical protein
MKYRVFKNSLTPLKAYIHVYLIRGHVQCFIIMYQNTQTFSWDSYCSTWLSLIMQGVLKRALEYHYKVFFKDPVLRTQSF